MTVIKEKQLKNVNVKIEHRSREYLGYPHTTEFREYKRLRVAYNRSSFAVKLQLKVGQIYIYVQYLRLLPGGILHEIDRDVCLP